MPEHTRVEDIKDKIHREFTKKLIKDKIPCSTGIIKKKDGKIKFLEVILARGPRYSDPSLIKKVPKTYKGVKVKAF